MKTTEKTRKQYFINLIFPAFIFGSLTGILSAAIIMLYKLCAKHIIHFSEIGYAYLRGQVYLIPIIAALLFGVALLFAFFYRKSSNLQGGGIPTSIGILRGIISFHWLRNLIGVFFLSLVSFLIGVPLGNEGPSVQMGTAVGKGSIACLAKKHRAWDRYAMTGGACAGFSIATGAPISGMLFGIEEAHQRISPMIMIVSATSVVFSHLTAQILSPLLGVSASLFPSLSLPTLTVKHIWIPVVIGIAVGLFAVLFLKYYKLLNKFWNETTEKLPHALKIFFVFLATLLLGVCSFSFISTGHELILTLFDGKISAYMLVLILLVRSSLTLSANSNRITGGIFLPILALGAVFSAILGRVLELIPGMGGEYYPLILVLGITACISAMMKMPLTAIVFAIEALSCYNNIFYVITVSAAAFIITEIFEVTSINDSVLDNRIEKQNRVKELKVIDTFITVQKDSFAIGKQIRDIFWPANLFVLSLKHGENHGVEVDEHGTKAIDEGDIIHVRYSTYDELQTREELMAIVGEQEYIETETDVV
ncbi:MAG: chloride channel protein [Clostridia bacterium]|nr:chloride channel protein [Clostridia bacterium]